MAKGSSRLVLSFLLLSLLYVAFLRLNFSSHHPWKFQLSRWPNGGFLSLRSESSGVNGGEYMRFLLRKLVRGKARKKLSKTGFSCVSDVKSTICITTAAVRISTGQPVIYLSGGQNLSNFQNLTVQPYPRKSEEWAMQRTIPITLIGSDSNTPVCDVTHVVPAVVFSPGGYAGNFFHDINDVIIPLFLTAGHFRSQVQLVVSDHRPFWIKRYSRFLSHLSAYDVVVASSSYVPVDTRVHCFPGVVVGVKYHNNFECNSTDTPGGVTILDFKRFLQESFSLKIARAVSPVTQKPLLLLISRRRSRALLNEDQVVQLAEDVGFRVVLAPPRRISSISEFPELVNSCNVLMGVHGAGLTNMIFLPSDAVVLQVVPWGLDWASKTYYGRGPTGRFGLRYVEYRSTAQESSLYNVYPKDHPVLTDPWSIHRQGYSVSKPVYTDGQNLTVDLSRFRHTLLQAMALLPRPPTL